VTDSLVSKYLLINNKNSEHGSLFLFVCLVLVLATALSACQAQAPSKEQYVFTGPIMGTDYRITVVATSSELQQALENRASEANDASNSSDANEVSLPEKDGVASLSKDGEVSLLTKDEVSRLLEGLILDAMNSVNQSMSNYIDSSEISRFNRLPAGVPFALSDDFYVVMSEAQRISTLSDGAFDVTLAKAIDAWGFGPDGQINRKPSDQRLEQLRAVTGYQKLVLENQALSKSINGVELSLSAIAKGYAVDKVGYALSRLGLNNYLVNIGGELRASGRNLAGDIWRVGVEKPHLLGGVQEIVSLENASIATSGDYRNYLVVDGEQFSHTIEPKSLKPVFHKLALVSVISENAATADALATAMMAMGETQAWIFAQENKLAAYLIVRGETKEDFNIRSTEKFNVYLQ